MIRRYATLLSSIVLMAATPAVVLAVDIGTLHCNDATGVSLVLGQTLTVTGVVISQQPTGGNTRIYIQDATGGINVFGAPQYCGGLGDEVTVTGTILQFNGLTELASPLTIVVNSSGNPQPVPLVMTTTQANAAYQGNNCEPDESRLVKVLGLIRTSTGTVPLPGAVFTANTNYQLVKIGDPTDFVVMRVVQSANNCAITTPLVGMLIPVDCPTHVTGVLSQFDNATPFTSGWQLLPRQPSDVQEDCTVPTSHSTWGRVKTLYR